MITENTINEAVYSLSDVAMFLGWVCVEIPELHNLECPKLLEAWRKWCVQMDLPFDGEGNGR